MMLVMVVVLNPVPAGDVVDGGGSNRSLLVMVVMVVAPSPVPAGDGGGSNPIPARHTVDGGGSQPLSLSFIGGANEQ